MRAGFPELQERANISLELRRAQLEHLPVGFSPIAFDLLLCLYVGHLGGAEGISVKRLLAATPYGELTARYHLRKLVGQGWATLSNSDSDRRVRLVIPTTAAVEVMKSILNSGFRSLSPGYLKLPA